MSALLIIGAGGNGRVIADIASSLQVWDRIEFLDDTSRHRQFHTEFPIAGNCGDFEEVVDRFDGVVVGFGDNAMRSQWSERALSRGCALATIIAPTAWVSERSSLGAGSVVMPHAVVNVGVVSGACALINTSATVDHDCVLGDCVHVSPGTNLGGGVHVGHRSWLGIGCSVRQSIRIGADVQVGAGSVVISDVIDGITVVGVPARAVATG